MNRLDARGLGAQLRHLTGDQVAAGCRSLDLSASRQPVTIGYGGSAGRVAVVYDPGGSGYPRRTMTRLGEEMVSRGYVVELLRQRFNDEARKAAHPHRGGSLQRPAALAGGDHPPSGCGQGQLRAGSSSPPTCGRCSLEGRLQRVQGARGVLPAHLHHRGPAAPAGRSPEEALASGDGGATRSKS